MTFVRMKVVLAAAALALVVTPALAQSGTKQDNSPAAKEQGMQRRQAIEGTAPGTSGYGTEHSVPPQGTRVPSSEANKPTINRDSSDPKEFPGTDQNSH